MYFEIGFLAYRPNSFFLQDAQSKFRKMVEDNKQLAARIDTSIHAANEEVNVLRGELVDTNRRLSLISEATVTDVTKLPGDNNMATDLKKEQAKLSCSNRIPNNDCKWFFQYSFRSTFDVNYTFPG